METEGQTPKSVTIRKLQLCAWMFLLAGIALPMPALKRNITLTQADGAVFEATIQGDEWTSWTETIRGYSIAKGKNGHWYYVQSYSGNAALLSSVRADLDPPADALRSIRPPRHEDQVRVETQVMTANSDPLAGPPSRMGSRAE